MKRFQFRLETALRLRQLAEQQAQAALAEAERAVLAAEQALTKTLGERERHLAYYAQLQQQSKPDIALIAATCQYTEILEEHLATQRQIVRTALDARDKRREALQTSRRERELIEKLKEKKHQEYLLQEAAEEQAWLDEVAVLRFGRA